MDAYGIMTAPHWQDHVGTPCLGCVQFVDVAQVVCSRKGMAACCNTLLVWSEPAVLGVPEWAGGLESAITCVWWAVLNGLQQNSASTASAGL